MKPKSYREQDNCTMCKYVFRAPSCGGATEYFCNINGDRPVPCGSWVIKEKFFGTIEEQDAQFDIWNDWARSNEVFQYGICNEFINGKS
jgi:hypothetical protein